MTKIFKQLARHWAVCLVVFALLFVQAYCDLALPDYTSKIVDTGIQQGGIESPLPQTVRQSTLDALSLLMSEEDAQKLQNAYQYYLQDDGVLQLRSDLTEAERTALEDAVTTPDIVLYMAAAQAANTPAGQNSMGMTGLAETPSAAADADTETVTPTAADLDTVCSQFAAMSQMPGFDRSMLQKQLDGAMSQLDSTLLENLKSQSLLLVQLEYEAQGVAQDVQMGYLFRVGGQMLALTLLMVAVAVAVGFLASRVSAAIGRDLRRETFSSVIGFSNAEIENFSTASLITRTTNDIQQVQFVCVILLRMVAYAPILGIGGVLHVVGSSSGLSWIVVLDVAILLLLIIFLMSVAMPKFKVMQQLVDRLNLVSREILTGIMPVRAFSREKFEEQRFDKANRELMGTQLFTNRAMVAMMPFMTLIMNGTSLLIVWFGGKAMDAGTMQVGEMIAFITYTMQIVMSFLMLAMVAVMLPRAGVAADRIDEVIRTKATIHDPDKAAAKAAQAHTDWQGVVQFEDVSFRYPGADSDALEHISFTAKPGETTAIIGSTGCGKSTLLNLIPRFYDVTGGKVTVDGIDVREMPQAQLHDLLGLYSMIGERLKHAFTGNTAWILSYREECFDQIGLKATSKIPLFNGALECEFRQYEIFDGKYKEFRAEGEELSKERKEFRPASGERKEFKPGERREFRPRFSGERREFGSERREFNGERRPREFKDGEKREFRPRERREFKDGERREFRPRERREFGGERRTRSGESYPESKRREAGKKEEE